MLAPWILGPKRVPVIAVRPPLVRLLSQLPVPVVAGPVPMPADYPSICDVQDALSVRAYVPGDTPPHAFWADGRIRLDEAPGRVRVGLCWAGSDVDEAPTGRSIHRREDLLPLLDVPGVAFTALQLDDHVTVPSFCESHGIKSLADYGVQDFADTAGILRQLDLVITIDTAVLHLAAHLGIPTWALLECRSSWATMECGTPVYFHRDSLGFGLASTALHMQCYPAVWAFKQTFDGEWTEPLVPAPMTRFEPPVIARVAEVLSTFAAHRAAERLTLPR